MKNLKHLAVILLLAVILGGCKQKEECIISINDEQVHPHYENFHSFENITLSGEIKNNEVYVYGDNGCRYILNKSLYTLEIFSDKLPNYCGQVRYSNSAGLPIHNFYCYRNEEKVLQFTMTGNGVLYMYDLFNNLTTEMSTDPFLQENLPRIKCIEYRYSSDHMWAGVGLYRDCDNGVAYKVSGGLSCKNEMTGCDNILYDGTNLTCTNITCSNKSLRVIRVYNFTKIS